MIDKRAPHRHTHKSCIVVKARKRYWL